MLLSAHLMVSDILSANLAGQRSGNCCCCFYSNRSRRKCL